MTTQQTTWTKFDGSDEQIAELASNTFIVNNINSIFGNPKVVNTFYTGKTYEEDKLWLRNHFQEYGITKYWIIPADPLRDMKIRQAQTGQPVYYKYQRSDAHGNLINGDYEYGVTVDPHWDYPNTEYSFTPFED